MTVDVDLDLERIDVRHDLYLQRLAKTRQAMADHDVPVMLVRDPINVLYATGATNMTVFNLCVPARYLLLVVDGPVILFDYVGGEHLAEDLPTIDDVRTDEQTGMVSAAVHGGSATLTQVIDALDRDGVAVGEVGLRRATLDEVFLTLTGAPADARDADAGGEVGA